MPTSLSQKLQIKTGTRLAVLNEAEGWLPKLTEELQDVAVSAKTTGKPDAALVFVNDIAEAQSLTPKAIRAVGPDGLLWIAYPKGSSKVRTNVNRDSLRKTLETTGWCPVRQIALDDVWSAMRFRPEEKVGS